MTEVSLANYQSPGVYVKETPSEIKSITGVSTSTAGFIGVLDSIGKKTAIAYEEFQRTAVTDLKFPLKNKNVVTDKLNVLIDGIDVTATSKIEKIGSTDGYNLVLDASIAGPQPSENQKIKVFYEYQITIDAQEIFGTISSTVGDVNKFTLKPTVANQNEILDLISVIGEVTKPVPAANISLDNTTGLVTVTLKSDTSNQGKSVKFTYSYFPAPIPENTPVLCTNFAEFKNNFFGYSLENPKNYLAHAVSGFFANGGSRCYVICTTATDIDKAIKELENVAEIAMVAAPGNDNLAIRKKLIAHCEDNEGQYYRVAILDGKNNASPASPDDIKNCDNSKYAALYYPWIKVSNPNNPKLNLDIPPSGHIAGIYARVDNDRGVHKAPANETVRGAIGVSKPISINLQNGLNPVGINCIGLMNNNILVWGARTIGGDANQDMKYINVRRTLLFLRKSIEQNTQWVVFEPNTPGLWQKIARNITAFLTTVWRSGALFGSTADEAFYVKCDKENNTSETREAGFVITEIGVAIARPAEFVVFQISQWAGPG